MSILGSFIDEYKPTSWGVANGEMWFHAATSVEFLNLQDGIWILTGRRPQQQDDPHYIHSYWLLPSGWRVVLTVPVNAPYAEASA
jgi:hypothetical protein